MGSGASMEDEKRYNETHPKRGSVSIEEKDAMNINIIVKKKKPPKVIQNNEVNAPSSSTSGTQAALSSAQPAAASKDLTPEQLQKMAMGQKGYKDEHREYNTSLLHQKREVLWEEAVSPPVTNAPQALLGVKQSIVHLPLQKPPPKIVINPGSKMGGTGHVGSVAGQVSQADRFPTNILDTKYNTHARPPERKNPKNQIVYAPSDLPTASAAMQSAPPIHIIPDTSSSSGSGTNKIESSRQNIQSIGGNNTLQSKLKLANPAQRIQSPEISEFERSKIISNMSPFTPNRVPIPTHGQGSGVRSHDINQPGGRGGIYNTALSTSNPPNIINGTNVVTRSGQGVMSSNGPAPSRPNSNNNDPNRRLPVRPFPNSTVSHTNKDKSRSSDDGSEEDGRDGLIPPRPKNIPSLHLNSNMSTETDSPSLSGFVPNGKGYSSPEALRINTNVNGTGIYGTQNSQMNTAMSGQNRAVPPTGPQHIDRDSNKSNNTSMMSPTNNRGPATKPSTPVSIQYEVKETNDVKRNRVKLPPTMTHAKPTTGDWLKKRYIVNNYILLDTLGTGSYGEVRLCKDRTTDNLFAIKIISKEMLKKKKSGNSSETYFEDIRREIAIMKKLLHPNVLRLYEVLDDPNVNKMYLVLEYMKEGDLINVLKTRENTFASNSNGGNSNHSNTPSSSSNVSSLSDLELWNIFRQVVAGIRYLHYQNVVHGDIKPQVSCHIYL